MNLSPKEKDTLQQKRMLGYHKLRSLSFIQIVLASISILVGCLAVYFNSPIPSLPYSVATPLWTGIMIVITGIFGFVAGKIGPTEKEVTAKTRCFVILHFVFCVIMVTLCILSAGVQLIGVVFCSVDESAEIYRLCLPNTTANLACAIVGAIVGLLLSILSIMGTCFLCLYGRSMGFKNRYEIAMERGYHIRQNEELQ